MSRRYVSVACLLLFFSLVVAFPARGLAADECQLEHTDGLPEGLAPAVSKELNASHIKLRVGDEDFCEIWLAKVWERRDDGQGKSSPASVVYQLEPGSLVGAIRLAVDCYDLRDQLVPAGVYTLRYAVQPEIEAHKDSHESRDFLLLVGANVDESPATIADGDELISKSADSIGLLHPAFLPLLKVAKPSDAPAVRPDPRDPEGWLLRIDGKDRKGQSVPLEAILLFADFGG